MDLNDQSLYGSFFSIIFGEPKIYSLIFSMALCFWVKRKKNPRWIDTDEDDLQAPGRLFNLEQILHEFPKSYPVIEVVFVNATDTMVDVDDRVRCFVVSLIRIYRF